ncbi:MAG: hypothetical protein IRY91_00035 [Gemmatimonadaceae bacterium]|nr:hypothetical protein [Gemmatimonadaceae bacterium]
MKTSIVSIELGSIWSSRDGAVADLDAPLRPGGRDDDLLHLLHVRAQAEVEPRRGAEERVDDDEDDLHRVVAEAARHDRVLTVGHRVDEVVAAVVAHRAERGPADADLHAGDDLPRDRVAHLPPHHSLRAVEACVRAPSGAARFLAPYEHEVSGLGRAHHDPRSPQDLLERLARAHRVRVDRHAPAAGEDLLRVGELQVGHPIDRLNRLDERGVAQRESDRAVERRRPARGRRDGRGTAWRRVDGRLRPTSRCSAGDRQHDGQSQAEGHVAFLVVVT